MRDESTEMPAGEMPTTAVRAVRARGRGTWLPCAVWGSAYFVAFGGSALAALVYFADGLPEVGEGPVEAAYVGQWQLGAIGVGFAAVAWVLARYHVIRRFVTRPRPVSAGVVTFAAGVFGTSCALCMYALGALITWFDAERGEAYTSFADKSAFVEIGGAIHAGVAEEIIMVGALVGVVSMFGTGRRALLWCVVISVIGRVAFHMYYGPAVFVIVPWAALSVWVYWRFRSWAVLLAMVVMHSAADLTGGVSRAVYLVVSIALLAAGWWVLRRDRRRVAPWITQRGVRPAEITRG